MYHRVIYMLTCHARTSVPLSSSGLLTIFQQPLNLWCGETTRKDIVVMDNWGLTARSYFLILFCYHQKGVIFPLAKASSLLARA